MVEIVCPNDATAKINAILSGRRGQILGFDTRDGWAGWDAVKAMMPETEIGDLIIEIRSATAGVGTFTASSTTWRSSPAAPPIRSLRRRKLPRRQRKGTALGR